MIWLVGQPFQSLTTIGVGTFSGFFMSIVIKSVANVTYVSNTVVKALIVCNQSSNK